VSVDESDHRITACPRDPPASKGSAARGVSIAELIGTKVIHDPKTKLNIRISRDVEPPVIF
jgi:hypothetical protein